MRNSPSKYPSPVPCCGLPGISLTLVLSALIILFGCSPAPSELPPTLIPVASAPEGALPAPAPALPEASRFNGFAGAASAPESSGAVDALNTGVPTPDGVGLRPGQTHQQYVPDAGPAVPDEWRPPPYEVPLSLHPDDHYWLSRPIPSNRRSYDLEWYPFGNDVQIAELAPYRIHHGIDLPNPQGTTVLACASGTVVHAGPLPSPRDGVNYYGNTVIVRHDWQWQGQDVYTLYAHTLELFVAVGEHVEQGQLIAGVGSSGEVTNSHLHLEVRVGSNSYGSARNPALWLAPYEGWGTLAGRFVDRRGRKIPGATITVTPVNVEAAVRKQSTYSLAVRSADVWQENFVIGDLPAGRYTLLISVNNITYRRDVELLPGRTTFEIISTQFDYIPTATPIPTATTAATFPAEGTPSADATATPQP